MQSYLTPEDFKTAKANGIRYEVAYNRFYCYGWSVKRAITTPVKNQSNTLWAQYKEQCKEIGLSNSAFHERIRKGMTPEEAATTPKQLFGRKKNVKVNQAVQDLAASNGISKNTLMRRVHYMGWSIERATTQPIRGKS